MKTATGAGLSQEQKSHPLVKVLPVTIEDNAPYLESCVQAEGRAVDAPITSVARLEHHHHTSYQDPRLTSLRKAQNKARKGAPLQLIIHSWNCARWSTASDKHITCFKSPVLRKQAGTGAARVSATCTTREKRQAGSERQRHLSRVGKGLAPRWTESCKPRAALQRALPSTFITSKSQLPPVDANAGAHLRSLQTAHQPSPRS